MEQIEDAVAMNDPFAPGAQRAQRGRQLLDGFDFLGGYFHLDCAAKSGAKRRDLYAGIRDLARPARTRGAQRPGRIVYWLLPFDFRRIVATVDFSRACSQIKKQESKMRQGRFLQGVDSGGAAYFWPAWARF